MTMTRSRTFIALTSVVVLLIAGGVWWARSASTTPPGSAPVAVGKSTPSSTRTKQPGASTTQPTPTPASSSEITFPKPFLVMRGQDGAHKWFLAARFQPDQNEVCVTMVDDATHHSWGGGCFDIVGVPSTAPPPTKMKNRLSGYDINPGPWQTEQWKNGQPLFIYGAVAASIPKVRVKTNVGTDVSRSTTTVPEAKGLRFYVIKLKPFSTGSIAAFDTHGKVREMQHFNGNPTIGPATLCDPSVPSCKD